MLWPKLPFSPESYSVLSSSHASWIRLGSGSDVNSIIHRLVTAWKKWLPFLTLFSEEYLGFHIPFSTHLPRKIGEFSRCLHTPMNTVHIRILRKVALLVFW